jgi:hypothetical protein
MAYDVLKKRGDAALEPAFLIVGAGAARPSSPSG